LPDSDAEYSMMIRIMKRRSFAPLKYAVAPTTEGTD